MVHHIIHWILDFIGVNNTYDSFSTHMYNFWSGFGGSISILALLGTVFGIYRHNLQRLEKSINPLHLVQQVQQQVQHKKDGDNNQSPPSSDGKPKL